MGVQLERGQAAVGAARKLYGQRRRRPGGRPGRWRPLAARRQALLVVSFVHCSNPSACLSHTLKFPHFLPAGVLVSFRMIDMDVEGGEDEEGEGSHHHLAQAANGNGSQIHSSKGGSVHASPISAPTPARGLCIGLTWLQAGGQALQVGWRVSRGRS